MGDTIEEMTQKIRADLQNRQQQVRALEQRQQEIVRATAQVEKQHEANLAAITKDHEKKTKAMLDSAEKDLARNRLETQRQFEDTMQAIQNARATQDAAMAQDRASLASERAAFEAEMERKRAALKLERDRMTGITAVVPDHLWLNVGGKSIFTTKTTLSSAGPDSMLSALVSGRWELPIMTDGSVFLDRDGDVFAMLVAWLRNRTLPTTYDDCERLQAEADYFCVPELRDILEDRSKKRFLSLCWVPSVAGKYSLEDAQLVGQPLGRGHCRGVMGGTPRERELLDRGTESGNQSNFCCANPSRAKEFFCSWNVVVHELMELGWTLVRDDIHAPRVARQAVHAATFERRLSPHVP